MSLSDQKPKFHHLQRYGAQTLLTAVTVLICACTRAPSLHSDSARPDSLSIHICSAPPCDHIDIFVFADTLTRPLEYHQRFRNPTFLRIPAGKGDKLVVALANVQGSFGALPERYSTMEHLTMKYADEDPKAPLQAGLCNAEAGKMAELDIQPLLCSISIGRISLDEDAPLEDAVVQLVNVNAQAEVLRSDGFHPSTTLDSPEGLRHPLMMLQEIPFDIGSRPQDAGITLWCYPNEDEDAPGGRCTALRICGRLRGETKEYRIPLGPVRRGTNRKLDIELKK